MSRCLSHDITYCQNCQKAWERKCVFGVYLWVESGQYTEEGAVGGKLYSSKRLAEKACERLNANWVSVRGGYVVRSFYKGE